MVIWIIGKSGSGKTFLAKKLCEAFSKIRKKIKWIDGDKFRARNSRDLGFSISDRKKNSKRIQNFCHKYEKRNYLVLCSILSIFKEHQKKNRTLFNDYLQIYIKVNSSILKKRNNKNIYKFKKNVVGKDIEFPNPYKSDLIIKNNFKKIFLKNIKKIEKLVYEKI